MKIAGAKNQGAWFRFNNWLLRRGPSGGPQPTEAKAALKAALSDLDTFDPFFAALTGIAADAGVTFPSDSALVDAWMLNGIPLQIWMGKLSWTEYDRTGETGAYVYTPRGQSEAHYFGHDLRRVCRHFQFSVRELADLTNALINNPGGQPNADQTN